MASPPDQPWSNPERNYLLAEIIKAANPPAEVLLDVIRRLPNQQPRWDDMPLPPNRSLNACRFAYDTMLRSLPTQSMSMPLGPQTPMTIPGPTLKRPFPPPEAPFSASGREIRPKPLTGGPGYHQPSPSEPPPKRKRGRPTKAEQQAKAEAAAAAMSFDSGPARPGAAPSRPTLMPVTTQGIGPSSATDEHKPMLPPTTRMPIAAMLTPTAQESKSASNSSSSSGKRRRGRSATTKTEPEETPTARSRSDHNSPHELRAAPEDSPARTAVLRHREELAPLQRIDPPRTSPESGQQQPQQPQHSYHPQYHYHQEHHQRQQ